jgi:putative nucleotidyltransferase with HDIG domain
MRERARAQETPVEHALADSIDEQLWFGEDDPAYADRAASESLAASVARIAGLKPLPVVAQKVLAALAVDDWSSKEVAQMVSSDPSLASMVLRLTNSSFYSRGIPVNSVHQAINRLGVVKLRELVVGVAAMSLVEGDTERAASWRDHCAGTAAVARWIADERQLDASAAFLGGLLHDMGKLLMLETKEIDYDEVSEAAEPCDEGLPAAERFHLDFDHAVLGGHVLREWGIPDPVPQMVAWHHQPGRAYEGGTDIARLVAVLRLADRITEVFDAEGQIDPGTLADSADAQVLGYDLETLSDYAGTLREVRAEALAVFKA